MKDGDSSTVDWFCALAEETTERKTEQNKNKKSTGNKQTKTHKMSMTWNWFGNDRTVRGSGAGGIAPASGGRSPEDGWGAASSCRITTRFRRTHQGRSGRGTRILGFCTIICLLRGVLEFQLVLLFDFRYQLRSGYRVFCGGGNGSEGRERYSGKRGSAVCGWKYDDIRTGENRIVCIHTYS